MGRDLNIFLNIFFIGFFIQYITENRVWICWLNASRGVQHALGPHFIIREHCPPRSTPYCGHGNPCGSLIEAVTPQTIPQFQPPDSLDYRRELILFGMRLEYMEWDKNCWPGMGLKYLGQDQNIWDRIKIFGIGLEYLGQDQNICDRIRILGIGLEYLGQDQNIWDRIRIFGMALQYLHYRGLVRFVSALNYYKRFLL